MFENSGIRSDPDLVDLEDFSGGALSVQAPANEVAITIDGGHLVGPGPAVEDGSRQPSDRVSVLLDTMDPQFSEFGELGAGKLICASNDNVKVGFHQDVVASGACVRESFDTKWSASSRLDGGWKAGRFLHLVVRGTDVQLHCTDVLSATVLTWMR